MNLHSWRSFVLRTAIGCAAVFATVRMALAREGVAGGAARSFVTVAGSITGASSPVRLTFTFRRADGTALCAPTVAGVALGAGGAFSAQVPIDAPCPATMFDGSNVQVDVAVNDAPIVGPDGGFAVNPVPYAHYASVAAGLAHADGWQQIGTDQFVFSVYLRGADVPACVAGFMTYNIGVPSTLGGRSRDALFSGTADVMTRPAVPEAWNRTAHYASSFYAYTHSGTNVTVCNLPYRDGDTTAQPVCTDAQSATLPSTSISIRRPDADSSRLNVIVPCDQMMERLSIHVNAFIRSAD